MTTKFLGSLGVGEVIPALPLLTATIGPLLAPQSAKVADIQARLAVPFTPPNPTAMLLALQQALGGMAASLAQLPVADAAMRVQLAGDLASLLGLVQQTQSLVTTLSAALSTGGVCAWTIDANAGSLGSELSAATSAGLPGGAGPTQHCNALVLATGDPTAWAALKTVVKT